MTTELPEDVQQQMAPGGQFPGHAETLATPVGSDQLVRVSTKQADKRHLQLSREEYRARSAHQREIDAQTDAPFNPPTKPDSRACHPTQEPPACVPNTKKGGRPKGSKNKPKPADQPNKTSGQPSPAPSTTPRKTTGSPPISDSEPDCSDGCTDHETCRNKPETNLEQRMSRLEAGVDKIIYALAERDALHENAGVQAQDATEALAELDAEFENEPDGVDVTTTLDSDSDEVEPDEPSDKPPVLVPATQVENDVDFDKGLQRLQQMITKRDPQKAFRRQWYQLSRAAQYNEWPPERREAFDQLFNSIVAHPKFIHQMSKFLRGSRSGNCIGDEQIARVCGMVAGFITVYQLAAAGK